MCSATPSPSPSAFTAWSGCTASSTPCALSGLKRDFPAIWAIAFPAMLTQLATPFANAYITHEVAPFGDEAVAASAIIGRLVPVAFGIIFALSGSVGPIIGQNFGARRALTG